MEELGFRVRLDWDQILTSPTKGVSLGTPFNLSGPPLPHRHQRGINTSYRERASQTRLHTGLTHLGLFKKQPGPDILILWGRGVAWAVRILRAPPGDSNVQQRVGAIR